MINKVDLKANPNYKTRTTFGDRGDYYITVRWNSISELWVIDITDSLDEPIFSSQPLIPYIDLFKSWRNLGVPVGKLIMLDNSSGDRNKKPTYANITEYSLYYTEV